MFHLGVSDLLGSDVNGNGLKECPPPPWAFVMPELAVTAPFGFNFDPVRFLTAYRAVGVTVAQFYRNEQKPPTVAENCPGARSGPTETFVCHASATSPPSVSP